MALFFLFWYNIINIKGDVDSDNRIVVRAGAAVDAAGNKTKAVESTNFTIKEKYVKDTVRPVVTITGVKPATVLANGTVTYNSSYRIFYIYY